MISNRVEVFLRDFISAWQVAKIYEVKHPKFLDSVAIAVASLDRILSDKKELIIGVVGGELACGEDIFFELSKKLDSAINQLLEKGVERIIFQKGVDKSELGQFIELLASHQTPSKDEFKDYLPLVGIRNIRVGRINDLESEKTAGSDLSLKNLAQYRTCLEGVSNSLDSLIDNDTIDFLKLKLVTNSIMDNLLGNYQMFLKISEIKTYDQMTFMHLLNVSILSIYFTHKLGFSRQDCLSVGSAALLHDIGKLFISRKIIRKEAKLEGWEIEAVKSHTSLGAEILLRYSKGLGILPAVVAFEHHLGWDCRGYPKMLFKRKPHLASLIVHICDEYDALIQRRSYKSDYPPEMVYGIMIKQKESKFPSHLIDAFFKAIGVWPKGTIVSLSDSRIAIVREVNSEDIHRPKVEVVSDGRGEIIDLSLKQRIVIKRSLNPLTEGKDYVDAI